ncbi:winged helix DNA-binding domain-containing protein [Nocardia blacklockiae]|uniref:winged helix DNA-binding domain-containing protein n=1 Tax=Nocardia blacklockiae TaxID=480036 RepID=UPI00189406EB|nr:winged helix DNA-binding domain-containing protein [Nocardia blacklockiae]MBF6170744.1 AlkZ family DNA glycosylase [Nocardia blacklockiae]
MRVTWDQVFAWRLRRQLVSPRGEGDAVAVAERLGGIQAQVTSAAETAAALRHSSAPPGGVVRALESGALVKTWAMRGTLHAVTPAFARAVLPLLASARTWEKPSWQKNFGASPAEVAALAEAVGEVLDGAVLTRAELVEALLADARFHALGEQLASGWGALLKPLAWQGVLCHGPARATNITFTAPTHFVPGWGPLLEPEAAAPHVITTYLGAYGPATEDAFSAWLLRGALSKKTVRQWFTDLGDALTEVDVEGRRAWLRTEDAEDLATTTPTTATHLLGPFDQYILGPGTNDTALLPAEHRARVSRTAGWISPLVLTAGRITGTWTTEADTLTLTMFDNTPPPLPALQEEIAAVARATAQPALRLSAGRDA